MLNKLTRLSSLPPQPTLDFPHIQLDWLWERFVRRYENPETRNGVDAVLNAYKHFLTETSAYDERLREDSRFSLAVHLNEFSICRAESFWREKELASWTIHNYVKVLKAIFEFASAERLTSVSQFIHPDIKVKRETKSREAYSDEELTLIGQIISEAVEKARSIISGYKRTNVGKDPRKAFNHKKNSGEGWEEWNNLVWYFENVMNCIAFGERALSRSQAEVKHTYFFIAAREYHGGIQAVWDRLEVIPLVGANTIVPLVLKLAWETGLNPDSIINLKRNCLQEHDLFGYPIIRYFKQRSTGEKDLHLAIFDDPNENHLQLFPKQSEVIRETVEMILKLTEPLVDKALQDDKQFLLLYQPLKGYNPLNTVDRVLRVDRTVIKSWSKIIVDDLKKSGIDVLDSINLARFRPTKITQMVEEGQDLFRIQAVAGHASMRTTMDYLSTRQLEPKARREISKALIQIQKNAREYNADPKPYATHSDKFIPGFIYKGVMADCKNPYEPPKPVQGLKSYEKGQPCTYWNMCLFCPNVIITLRHLPLLMKYASEIQSSFSNHNLIQVPNIALYEKAIALISELLREVSEEDMSKIADWAELHDYYVDGVTFKAVRNEK